ncbi:MAG TPA: DivIVA domain-containing protein [Candidatus Methylomirabilis sp.]|nr:DivIVA domain-containing protein [Candidatus Methylomirabilis sp.]
MTDLTPIDITQREFPRRFRGLDPVEVKTFLEGVAEELQRLLKENALKDERIQRLEGEVQSYRERENELKTTLFATQRITDQMKDKVRKEADLILKDAELKAEKLLERAHLMLAQFQGKIADLKRQKALFEARIRAAIQLHQELLTAEAAEDASGPVEPKSPGTGA